MPPHFVRFDEIVIANGFNSMVVISAEAERSGETSNNTVELFFLMRFLRRARFGRDDIGVRLSRFREAQFKKLSCSQ